MFWGGFIGSVLLCAATIRYKKMSFLRFADVGGIAIALCLFGLFAYFSLGVAIAPNVNIPQAVVTTTYAGADPATVEANVTRPIEDAVVWHMGDER